jgi:hypothetical protein
MFVMLLLFILKLHNLLLPQRHCTLKIDYHVCNILLVPVNERCCSTLGYWFVCLFVAVVWYVFEILNTLQGLFIFLAFTCTKKVCRGLRAQLGLRRDQQTQGAKSAVNTGTAATWT